MTKVPNLQVELFGCTLKSPLVLASGILGTTRDLLKSVAAHGAGAVTIKSISVEARKGHPNPTVLNFGPGLINAVGYSNPGLEAAAEEFGDLQDVGAPVIGSLIGISEDDFARIASRFDALDFAALEIPLSCPHTPGFGRLGKQDNAEAAFRVVATVRAHSSKPIFVKLPPAASNLVDMAQAAKEAGAYGITAVNTIGPGMLIDVDTARPYLGFGIGGISGPPLKPLAVASVFQLYEAVDLPIIGTGGVTTGRDAVEMVMAGASAVGLGSAVMSRGLSVFAKIQEEIREILHARGVASLSELKGLAHHA